MFFEALQTSLPDSHTGDYEALGIIPAAPFNSVTALDRHSSMAHKKGMEEWIPVKVAESPR